MDRRERIARRVEDATTPQPHLTKGQIAQALGISRPALGRRLADGKWRYDQLETLAKLLHTTVDDLVGESTEIRNNNTPTH